MFKKISLAFICLSVVGCSSTSVIPSKDELNISPSDVIDLNLGNKESFRVGALLPLTGKYNTQGQGLKNATLMAIDDVNNKNLIVQFYDTKSTPEGARIAAENAINQNVDIFLGPLTSTEVKSVSNQAKDQDIPIISFSTTTDILQDGVYTLGLLIDDQVNKVVKYGAENGRSKLALFLPDNNTGVAVAKAAAKAAAANNVELVKIGFYKPETSDFSYQLKGFSDYTRRKARADKIKTNLKHQSDAGNINAAKILKRLNTVDSLGDVDFDMVLIPETGSRLKSIVAMLGYYDVFHPKVQFLGTSIWENAHLSNESTLINSVYPTLSRVHNAYFANKYYSIFSQRPNSLYSFAYDGVALASALSMQENSNLKESITNPDGYIGINGVFRLFENGYNQHSLDVSKVTKAGDIVIRNAPNKFNSTEAPYSKNVIVFNESFKAPLIYGKDKEIVYNTMFNNIVGPENQHSTYISPEKERQILASSLKKLNIILP